MTTIEKPGLYPDMPESVYHADPAPAPSLSSSVAKTLLGASPLHAWAVHPRLNPEHEPKQKNTFDLGSAAHFLILGSTQRLAIGEWDSWRKADAKEFKADAYANDQTPLTPEEWERVQEMSRAVRLQLDVHSDAAEAFTGGVPEVSLFWQEQTKHGPIWCRCRLDYYRKDSIIFDDFKSTGILAHPEAFQRNFFEMGYDFQSAFYSRGIRAVLGVEDPIFRFVVAENKSPFALCVHALPPAERQIADRKVELAIQKWGECLYTETWPAYPNVTCYLEAPGWQRAKWEEREARGEFPNEVLLHWQRPLTSKKEGEAA